MFARQGTLYRQVNPVYAHHYDRLMQSGLYQGLVDKGWLIPHEETDLEHAYSPPAHRVLRPQAVPFISYPYEWCFEQLKQAALLTLDVLKLSLPQGMILKDATAYNVQFLGTRPVFIDTLSFESYSEGQPWKAYGQFCQHFLAPLLLMAYRDVRLGQLSRVYLDGVPLDVASSLLPRRTLFKLGALTHVHLHARSQARFSQASATQREVRISRTGLLGIVDNLESTIRGLRWRESGNWQGYYQDTNYSDQAMRAKEQMVTQLVAQVTPQPPSVWDLGANTGSFSRLLARQGMSVVAFDLDPACVQRGLELARSESLNVLPLVQDLANPAPSQGWAHKERSSLEERGPADLLLALALVHHLRISCMVPFAGQAEFLARLAPWLLVEYVGGDDSQVQRLCQGNLERYQDYSEEGFQAGFARFYETVSRETIPGTSRVLYLFRKASEPPDCPLPSRP